MKFLQKNPVGFLALLCSLQMKGKKRFSSNSADHVSHEEEEDVHPPKEDIAQVDAVEIVGKVSGAFSSAVLFVNIFYPFF
jgi:hypothetical protein